MTLLGWDMAIAEQWDEVWNSHLIERTHLHALWTYLISLFLLFPKLFFVLALENESTHNFY